MSRDPTVLAATAVARIGVDVGGTFTDVILQRPDGRATIRKLLSTPPHYDLRRRRGGRRALGRASAVADEVVHGTTVATNAVLERRGALTRARHDRRASATCSSCGALRMPHMYDLFWRKPPPLVARRLRFEVDERDERRRHGAAAARRRRGAGARGAAARDSASSRSPSACCTRTASRRTSERSARSCARSCRTSPSRSRARSCASSSEYERTATTVVNAYVRAADGALRRRHPRRASTRRGLDGAAHDHAVLGRRDDRGRRRAPAGARARVRAGGGRRRRARRSRSGSGIANAISFDMGGTTAKASLIEDGARLAQPRVRGRRLALGGQPPDARLRRAAPHPDDRHRRGRRRRRLPRLARRGAAGCRSGRAARAPIPGRPATAAAARSRP